MISFAGFVYFVSRKTARPIKNIGLVASTADATLLKVPDKKGKLLIDNGHMPAACLPVCVIDE